MKGWSRTSLGPFDILANVGIVGRPHLKSDERADRHIIKRARQRIANWRNVASSSPGCPAPEREAAIQWGWEAGLEDMPPREYWTSAQRDRWRGKRHERLHGDDQHKWDGILADKKLRTSRGKGLIYKTPDDLDDIWGAKARAEAIGGCWKLPLKTMDQQEVDAYLADPYSKKNFARVSNELALGIGTKSTVIREISEEATLINAATASPRLEGPARTGPLRHYPWPKTDPSWAAIARSRREATLHTLLRGCHELSRLPGAARRRQCSS